MKIELDLPDWCDERHIRVLAGIECVAYKRSGEDKFLIKTARCNQCGKCCKNLYERWMYYDPVMGCTKLERSPGKEEKYTCTLGNKRPLGCCSSDPVLNGWEGAEDYCSIRWKVVE